MGVVAALATTMSAWTVAPAAAQDSSGAFSDDDGAYYEAPFDALAERGILTGTECAEGQICPGDPIKRSTMAVWLGRALTGSEPTDTGTSRFADVDADHWTAPHIERFAELGVTLGCATDPLRYCPDQDVVRAQMAAFLVRAFELDDAPSAGFTDTSGHHFETEIDKLAAARITVGCTAEPLRYCPDRHVNRGQMATFIARALGLTPPPEPQPATADTEPAISISDTHGCKLSADGRLACWGDDTHGQASPPPGTYTDIAVNTDYSCAIRTDGRLACWGDDTDGRATPPAGEFTDVTANYSHPCGLRADGTIICWGFARVEYPGGERTDRPPSGAFTDISLGGAVGCGVRTDQSIQCWGYTSVPNGIGSSPQGTFTAVDVANRRACALRTDDTITCWGSAWEAVSDAPAGSYTDISVGGPARSGYSCALRTDLTITCWGSQDTVTLPLRPGEQQPTTIAGLTNPPSGRYQALALTKTALTNYHACALRDDNTHTCWGGPTPGDSDTVEDDQNDANAQDNGSANAEEATDCNIEPPGPPLDIQPHWEDGNLTVRWRSSDTGGPVEKYYVDRTVAGERYPAISSGILTQPGHPITGRHHLNQAWKFGRSFWHDGDQQYSYTLYDDVSNNTGPVIRLPYTSQVRLVALNCAGFAASEPVDVPTIAAAQHEQLKADLQDMVDSYSDAVPWLREVWTYITQRERGAFSDRNNPFQLRYFILLNEAHPTLNAPGFAYPLPVCEEVASPICKGSSISIGVLYTPPLNERNRASFVRIASHELAHIYTLSNDAPASSLAVAAGLLYLQRLLSSDPSWTPTTFFDGGFHCSAVELIADLGELLVLEQLDAYSVPATSLGYWRECQPGGSGVPSDEAISIARSVFGGQVPQWYYDTYRDSDGSYKLDMLWVDLASVSGQGSQSVFLTYLFRDEFGGYCSDAHAIRALVDPSLGNPWRDGGCAERTRALGKQVSAADQYSCAIGESDSITCWGTNAWGATSAPTGSFARIDTGRGHACGLRLDQEVVCWGTNTADDLSHGGQASPPAGAFIDITTGSDFSCGIRTDQTILCWGSDWAGKLNAPAGSFTAISAGRYHSCGIRTDQSLSCWGSLSGSMFLIPTDTFTSVSAGDAYTCGVRTDQIVVCWGWNNRGETNAPTGTFRDIAAGSTHTCGLRTDKTVVCWGDNRYGQTDAPAGTFDAVAVGSGHSCGITTDRVITCWGNDDRGQASPPGVPAN